MKQITDEKELDTAYRIVKSYRIDCDYWCIQERVKINQPFKGLKTFLFLLHFKVDISDKYAWRYLDKYGRVVKYPFSPELYTSEDNAIKALKKLKKRRGW